MDSLQELTKFLLQNTQTIVFGNLGRHPEVLSKALTSIPHINIAIISPNNLFTPQTPDNRIRVIQPQYAHTERCDLMIFIEPHPFKLIDKPVHAARVAVFSSHLSFQTLPDSIWTYAAYFHTLGTLADLSRRTKHLLNRQDASVQTNNLTLIPVDAVHKLIISGHTDGVIDSNDTYVIIDLRECTTAFEMYLAFWNAFDFLVSHYDSVSGWIICFPERNGRNIFNQFTQKCIDALFCKKFEHGNVTKLNVLLSLIPFYRSGIVDQTFKVVQSSFGGIKTVSPKTVLDTCKAAANYNLEHWVNSTYRIKE